MEKLILPDGSVIASGVQGEPAILSVTWKQSRNEGAEIAPGAVCCASLEIELFSMEKPDIPPETRMIYQEDDSIRGIFYCQSVTRQSQNRWVLSALDGMHRFYREINDFWEARTDDTVFSLLLGLCDHCGVATDLTELPGGTLPVPRLAGYSARQILRFLGQVAGRYFYMDESEKLRAGWFHSVETIDNFYQLKTAEYATAPIARVWLRQTKNDLGIAYPAGETEANTLILQGNPIFCADESLSSETFRHYSTILSNEEEETSVDAVAQRLFRQFSTFSHTPFVCKLLPGQEVSPGCMVEFTDLDGQTRLGAVMQWEKKNGILTVRGTGSHSLQSVAAFTERTEEALEGQVLELSRTAQGLSVSHRDLLGNLGAMQLSLSGLETQVNQGLTDQSSALRQTAQGFSMAVSRLEDQLDGKTDRQELTQVTEHFKFDAAGLTIQNSATGMGIRVSQQQVEFLGDSDPTTAIYPDSMTTARLAVGKRLDLGDFTYLPRSNGNLSFRYTGKG